MSDVEGEFNWVEVNPSSNLPGLVSRLAMVWRVSKQRVRQLLAQGRVSGVYKNPLTGQWEKPGHFSEVKLKRGKRGPKSRRVHSFYL